MTKPGVKHISYLDLIKNSIKYALSDWVAILIFTNSVSDENAFECQS